MRISLPSLSQPPRLRTATAPDAERHASWLELFFDLVLVVAVASLAESLVENHSLLGFAHVAGLFLPIFIAWQGFSLYSDRFDNDDLLHRLALFSGMFAVGALSVQIRQVAEGKSLGFAIAYIALRLITVLLYLRAYYHNPIARPLLLRYLSGYSLSIAFWLGSLFVPAPLCYWFWGAGIVSDLAMPPLSLSLIRKTPISTSHIAERFGLFVLLVMGESVVAVTQGMTQTTLGGSMVLVSALGLGLAAALWWLYFCDGEDLELRPGSTGVAFAYWHIPMLFGLTIIGAGVHLLIEAGGHGSSELDAGTRWAIGAGIALFLISLSRVQYEQKRGVPPVAHWLRPTVSIIVLGVAALTIHHSPVLYATIMTGSIVLLVLSETESQRRTSVSLAPESD